MVIFYHDDDDDDDEDDDDNDEDDDDKYDDDDAADSRVPWRAVWPGDPIRRPPRLAPKQHSALSANPILLPSQYWLKQYWLHPILYHPNTLLYHSNTAPKQYSTNIPLIPILSQTTLCSSVPSQYCLPNNTLTSQYCVCMLLMILQKHSVPFQNCSQTLKLKYFSANPILLLIILPNKMSYNIHWSPVLWTKSVQSCCNLFCDDGALSFSLLCLVLMGLPPSTTTHWQLHGFHMTVQPVDSLVKRRRRWHRSINWKIQEK